MLCVEKPQGSPSVHEQASSEQPKIVFTMMGGFIRKEPSNSKKLWETPKVVDLFSYAHWMSFCDKLQGHDDEITE